MREFGELDTEPLRASWVYKSGTRRANDKTQMMIRLYKRLPATKTTFNGARDFQFKPIFIEQCSTLNNPLQPMLYNSVFKITSNICELIRASPKTMQIEKNNEKSEQKCKP